jgi:hypothetical protein
MHADPIFIVDPIIMTDRGSFITQILNHIFISIACAQKIGWLHKYKITPTRAGHSVFFEISVRFFGFKKTSVF